MQVIAVDGRVLNMPSLPARPGSILSNYTTKQYSRKSLVFQRDGRSFLVHICQRIASEIECAVISRTLIVILFLSLSRSLSFHLIYLLSCFLLQDMRKQEWTAIIPNSQLIVIPYPQNDPRRYSHPHKQTQISDLYYTGIIYDFSSTPYKDFPHLLSICTTIQIHRRQANNDKPVKLIKSSFTPAQNPSHE